MKTLITGGSGWFGKALRPLFPNATWLSRTAREGFVTALPKGRFDYIIDMTPSMNGLDDLISFAKIAQVKKVLYVSSGAVYGSNVFCADEQTYICPQSDYAEEKIGHETAWLGTQLNVVIARPFAFSGPNMPLSNFALGQFILGAREGLIQVKGKSYRSYLDESDLAAWLYFLLTQDAQGIYNIGSELIIDTHGLAKMVQNIVNREAVIVTSGYEGTFYVPRIQRVINLGLHQTISLADSIRRML